MKPYLVIPTIICSLIAVPALANTSQVAGNGPVAQAGTTYGGAAAAQTQGQHQSATGGAGGSATGGSSTSSSSANPNATSNSNSGGSSAGVTISNKNSWPTASAIAPAVMSVNPCSGSAASGAVQTGLFGLSIGTGGGFDNACRLHMLGLDAAAAAYLCRSNADVRQAFRDIGQPCPQDRKPALTLKQDKGLPDYCSTRDAGDLNQHPECDTVTTVRGWGAGWPYVPPPYAGGN